MIRARAVGNAVFLETEDGCADVASWSESYPMSAGWVASQINQAIARSVQDVRAEAELLRAENARLREALKPLVDEYQATSDYVHVLIENVLLRKAKEAMEDQP